MQNATAMLYCPNYSCQTPNPETHKFCQKCRTSLPKHYLWAVGEAAVAYAPGTLLANRFLCKIPRVFLDTKPGLVAGAVTEIAQVFLRYLRLSPYQLHIPQVYEVVEAELPASDRRILLLDLAAVHVPPGTASVQLLPALTEVWHTASALRQLNWLWQIAQLWQPLSSEQAVSSLLIPELVRVEGSLVRLLELYSDSSTETRVPTLAQLGQLWASWVATAQPTIAAFLDQLCQQLIAGEILSGDQLVATLDQSLAIVGQGQSRKIQIATRTDQGPTRQRNEDACFPASGTVKTQTISPDQTAADPALVIVCDGIGGHQGGDVASNLAIATVQQQLQSLHAEQLDAAALSTALENAIWVANDQISQRNDSEQRLDRQRMGTTLVMGLVRTYELYTAHVGDSRAYWITRWNCRQVTLDDDIASREVRLGYSSYREALQQPSSGSLVQALGMASSNTLHPTVQRFILDEDCIFLLCSDGLSDNDRIEEIWDTDILPLLDGKFDLATISQQLVTIANTRNGHDNVTIGLLYCQVAEQQSVPPLTALTPAQAAPAQRQEPTTVVPAHPEPVVTQPPTDPTNSTLKTQIIQPARRSPNILPLLLGIILLLGLGGLLAYFLFPSVSERVDPYLGLAPGSTPEPIAEPVDGTVPATSPKPIAPALAVNSFLQIDRPTDPSGGSTPAPLVLYPQPNTTSVATDSSQPTIPPGSILQVSRRQGSSAADRWIQVRVCSIAAADPTTASPTDPVAPERGSPTATAPDSPDSASPTAALVQAGTTGWVQESALSGRASSSRDLTAAQQGACVEPSTPASPSPSQPIPSGSPAS
jgi:serine/threonine protein phosphatase PrpC